MNLINKEQLFFKYRSLKGENFEHFIDIVLNSRLYGASYKDLNDPMEGRYNKKGLETEDFKIINGSLKRSFICSFSKKQEDHKYPDNYLMWSHYADGHRGCCIEFTLKDNKNYWKVDEIKYNNEMPKFSKQDIENSIDNFLYNKTELWKNEQEWRAVKHYKKAKNSKNQQKPSPYYYIKIKSVYIGLKNTKKQVKQYEKLIKAIDKDIIVHKMEPKNFQTVSGIC